MLKTTILLTITLFSLAISSIISVQSWNADRSHRASDIVIHQGRAYLAMQSISAGVAPNQSGAWVNIANYSNPGNYRHDSLYVEGDIVRHNNEIFVARRQTRYTRPDKNDLWGAWIFVSNHAPIRQPDPNPDPEDPDPDPEQPEEPEEPDTGIFSRLPPDPGAAGKRTILGIDSEGHGVRDDILIAVTKLIPDDPYKRAGALFPFAMQQQLWKVVLENPNKPFEFYFPYLMGIDAGVAYAIETGASDILSVRRRQALLLNTRERFLMSQKIDSIASGSVTRGYEDYPDLKVKYDRKFQELYQRELERQR